MAPQNRLFSALQDRFAIVLGLKKAYFAPPPSEPNSPNKKARRRSDFRRATSRKKICLLNGELFCTFWEELFGERLCFAELKLQLHALILLRYHSINAEIEKMKFCGAPI